MAVGAGGAFTGGVKRLPPVGLMLFSVGETVADGAVVVVVVVVLDGPALRIRHLRRRSTLPPRWRQRMPTVAATRRVSRRFF
jgi:hypothetical protein